MRLADLCKIVNDFYNYFKKKKEKIKSDCQIEFLCGCLSGWAQVLTMQPF